MENRYAHKWPMISLLLALALHVLLLLSATVMILFPSPTNQKPPQFQTVPSYIYKGAITPTSASIPEKAAQSAKKMTREPRPKPIEHAEKSLPARDVWGYRQAPSLMESTHEILHNQFIKLAMNKHTVSDPILMIGDPNVEASPLLKLLAHALSANFNYPKVEGNFGIRGKVIVSLVLHPEGYISDVQIVESSNNDNFDASALYAVNKAPTVRGASQFITQPKDFIIGFLFD